MRYERKSRNLVLGGITIGFVEPDGKLFLTRCGRCELENWTMSVARGACAWCGWTVKVEADPCEEIKRRNEKATG